MRENQPLLFCFAKTKIILVDGGFERKTLVGAFYLVARFIRGCHRTTEPRVTTAFATSSLSICVE